METNTVLLCHTSGRYLTRGKKYPVLKETGYTYMVQDDYFNNHSFSKNPDPDDEVSFRTYFYIKGEGINKDNQMIIEKDEKTLEEQVFELGCQVSMLEELVSQLIGELESNGIPVSDTLHIPYIEDKE